MPMQWINILSHPSVTEKASMLIKLKYEMTVDDVYDMLEYLEFEDLKAAIQNEIEQKALQKQ